MAARCSYCLRDACDVATLAPDVLICADCSGVMATTATSKRSWFAGLARFIADIRTHRANCRVAPLVSAPTPPVTLADQVMQALPTPPIPASVVALVSVAPNQGQAHMPFIQTIKADAEAVGAFLVTEEKKVLALIASAPAPVQAAITALVTDAKAAETVILGASGTAVATEFSNVEDALTTALANFVSKVSNGNTATLLTSLGAAGLADAANVVEGLVKPIFVKILADAAPATA